MSDVPGQPEEKKMSNKMSNKTLDRSEKKSRISSVMNASSLDYRSCLDMDIFVSRKHVRSDFASEKYSTNQTATLYINQSDAFINPESSYLIFRYHMEPADVTGLAGEMLPLATNIINTITITSKSGQQIERVENVAELNAHMQKWQHGKEYLKNNLSCMYHSKTTAGPLFYTASDDYKRVVAGIDKKEAEKDHADSKESVYAIPLKYLLGVFNNKKRSLLPHILLSGARVDVTFNNPSKSHIFSGTVTKDIGYVSKMSFVLDTLQLNDGVLSAVNKMASTGDGLELCFDSWDSSTAIHKQVDIVNLSFNKALSKANHAFVVAIPNKTLAENCIADSFLTSPKKIIAQKYRLGSLFLPAQELVSDNPESTMEHYMNALYVMENLRGTDCAISYKDFNEGYQIGACTLERNQNADVKGQLLSNGRSLEAHIKYAAQFESPSDTTTYFFVNYTKLLQCYVNKVLVGE